ncbi:uncharacterized protein [Drosophila bipectinata]|uniref:uncharacterized protein n=1 Tax=Drosophila bipectinata TaxID=42026 RepID=UPI001C89139B|nr:uncharacterized protein LOC108129422 [Drosophila bipectinata]
MCPCAVREWLVLLTMEKYIGKFLERGYDTIETCQKIVLSDLVMIGVEDYSHRKLLLDGVQLLINCPESFVCLEPHNHTDAQMEEVPIGMQEMVFARKSPDDFEFFDTNTVEKERNVLSPFSKPASNFKKSGIPVFSKSIFYSKNEESARISTLNAQICAAVKANMMNLTCPQVIRRHVPCVDHITHTFDDITCQFESEVQDCTSEDDEDFIILD